MKHKSVIPLVAALSVLSASAHEHSSNADDYHYHAAPLHLEDTVGKGRPIAYALDGYPILGLTDPDDSKPGALDAFNGHTTEIGYKLSYKVNGEQRSIAYSANPNGTYTFEFKNGKSEAIKKTYTPRKQDSPRKISNAAPPPQAPASKFGPDALKKPNATFILTSPEVKNGGPLPKDFTGDGSGATLPLLWKGAPAGTKSFALIMDHLTPDNTMKHYWTLWNIPATTTEIPKNAKGVGKIGTSFNGHIGYEPPHSKGPGAKTYVLTVYALSESLQISQAPEQVGRDALLAAMKGKVLASSSLNVVYTRSVEGSGAGNDGQNPPPPRHRPEPPATRQAPSNPDKPSRRPRRRDDGGLIKPATSEHLT